MNQQDAGSLWLTQYFEIEVKEGKYIVMSRTGEITAVKEVELKAGATY